MKFTSLIDNYHSKKWELTLQEAYVFSWIYDVPSWAKTLIIGAEVWYFAAKPKAISDIPLLTDKVDTMYRHYKKLEEKGLIENKKVGSEDYIRITEKGKQWGSIGKKSEYSENNPSKLGKLSELDSENNPTYYTITNTNYSISNKEIHVVEENFEKKANTEKPNTENPFTVEKSILIAYNQLSGRSIDIDTKSNLEPVIGALKWLKKEKKMVGKEAEKYLLEYLGFRNTLLVKNGGFMEDHHFNPNTLFRKTRLADSFASFEAKRDTNKTYTQEELDNISLEALTEGLNASNWKKRLEVAKKALNIAKTNEEYQAANSLVGTIQSNAHQKGWF